MPELPEVETVRRGIAPLSCGRRIGRVVVRCRKLRKPIDARLRAKISGKIIRQIRRRAKYLIFELEDDAGESSLAIIAHLGMSGVFYFSDKPPQQKHEHIGLELGGRFLIYRDPRRFGCFVLANTKSAPIESHPLLCKLGVEPLSAAFNGRSFLATLQKRQVSIKTALLDGRIVAGVGNIYASESLHAAGISPNTIAANISAVRAQRLAKAIKDILRRAIRAGGSTIRDYAQPSGEAGFFQMSWKVYGRADMPCACGGTIRKIQQNGRATYYCPKCQR